MRSRKWIPIYVALLEFVVAIANCHPQSIYTPYTFQTLAGGRWGPGSADGTGTEAQFGMDWDEGGPKGLAVDGAGNLYVVDSGNYTIRKITPAGVVTTLAGSPGQVGSTDGMGAQARFGAYVGMGFLGPRGIAVDRAGTIFVTDTYNHTIRRISPDGMVSTLAGLAGSPGFADGDGSDARFNCPDGIALDGSGNLFVSDTANNQIRIVTPTGSVRTLFSGSGALTIDLQGNVILAASFSKDVNGNITVAENPGTFRIGPAGVWDTRSEVLAPMGFCADWGEGLAMDRSGNLYLADSCNHAICLVTPAGILTTIAGQPGQQGYADGPGRNALFSDPAAVAVDDAGNVYVTDWIRVRKIDPSGNVSTFAGSAYDDGNQDGIGPVARFAAPGGVAVDGAGTVYLADTGNNTIRKITPAGAVTTWIGAAGQTGSADGIGTAARFNEPGGITVDSAGNVYVADTANRVIRKITQSGEVTTFAGKSSPPGPGFDPRAAYADGAGQDARFEYPVDVSVDNVGNVYVADSGNRAIRKITPEGVVTTIAGDPSIRDESGYVIGGYVDGLASAAQFLQPAALTVDSAGTVYVADGGTMIRSISPSGNVTTIAGDPAQTGGRDGLGGQAQFSWPSGLAVDRAGNIYVMDAGNQLIRKLTASGTHWMVTTLAGQAGVPGSNDGTGQAARFSGFTGNVAGIAVDRAGNVYVADAGNKVIRKGLPALAIVSTGPAFGFRTGQFAFDMAGPPGQTVTIEASNDLINWLPVWTTSLTGFGTTRFSERQSGNINRFYRARLSQSGAP
jgi:sugar lactone lactonase YvrE